MQEVERYYDDNALAERERLEKHPMEFALTMRALREYLLPKSRVLDVGGGPGRYAIALAQLGYRVTLVDLSAASVELAKVKAREAGVALEGLVHGNALELSVFSDASYDAVLLFGLLYHRKRGPEQSDQGGHGQVKAGRAFLRRLYQPLCLYH